MKKALVLFSIVFLSLSAIFAQATKEENIPSDTIVFVDSLEREVTIPKTIDRVAPSGNVAQLAIYAVAPEKMVGWATRLSNDAMDAFLPEVASLPVFGAFYGSKTNLNREAVIAADPEIIIDVGEIKGSKESMAKELDDLSSSIGIPVIFIEGYLENMDSVFSTLGKILGKENEGDKLASFTRDALETGKNNRGKINERVYYSSSKDGLVAIEDKSFHAQVLQYTGCNNVVPSTFSGSNATISLEQLYIWDPDVILLSNKDAYELALSDNSWKELKAVKNGKVYLIPSMPYSFIDSPPASNRIIGIYWIGAMLAPEECSYNIVEKTIEYYSLFYHKELTEKEAMTILGK